MSDRASSSSAGSAVVVAPRTVSLSVWAPAAAEVALWLGADRRAPMVRDPRGYWTTEAAIGSDGYAFVVDGSEPLPDPRSGWQPQGAFGRSYLVDHDRFSWTDYPFQPPPLAEAIVYELHVGTFSEAGTFAAAIARLDHLVALGVTHVELMPVATFPGERGWGYDGVLLFAPHPAYGTPDELKALVDACHARGLAVLLDVVYNHLGPSGNVLPRFGPYFTERYRTPWGPAVNLDDADSDEVRRFFLDNARQWLVDYHFDGLRVDAVHALVDRSALHLVEEIVAQARAIGHEGRPRVVIAESDLNDPRVVRPPAEGGWGCDAQWSDDFHHALHALLTGESDGYYVDFGGMAPLARALEQAFVYDGRRSSFRRRRHGRSAQGLSGHRFLGYAQNHDQVGNRAQGERSGQLLSPGRLQIAAALVLTAPFVPMLFQGEEWGASAPFLYFTDHPDPEIGALVREGRRQEFAAFGWDPARIPDPQGSDAFTRSKLRWAEIEREPHRSLLEWHRALVRLRRTSADLGNGDLGALQTAFDETAGWFRMDRGTVSVAFNLAADAAWVPLPPAVDRVRLASASAELLDGRVRLPPDAVAILTRSR